MKLLLITSLIIFNSVNMYPIKSEPCTEPTATTKIGKVLLSIKQDHVSIFFNKHYKAAERLKELHNIPIAISLAQWALESSFGRSKLAKNNLNLGGIKYNSQYKCYESETAFYFDYSRVLNRDCYKSIDRSNVDEWLDVLMFNKCGYAQSKEYKKKLKIIIKKYKLNEL